MFAVVQLLYFVGYLNKSFFFFWIAFFLLFFFLPITTKKFKFRSEIYLKIYLLFIFIKEMFYFLLLLDKFKGKNIFK